MNVWKVGSRWNEKGRPDTSVYDVFIKFNIVFVAFPKEEQINKIMIGDLFAIGNGNTIVATGIVLNLPKIINKENFENFEEIENYTNENLLLSILWEGVIGFKTKIFELNKTDYFDYLSRQRFHKTSEYYENIILNIFEKNYIFLSEQKLLNNNLPYCIQQLRIKNYLGIKEIRISNIPNNTQWIFLTGENGFGKTSILKSIVICLNGKNDKNEELINSIVEIKNNELIHINLVGENNFKIFDKFVAYGAFRTKLFQRNEELNITDNLFGKTDYIIDFERIYKDWKLFPEKNEHKIISFETIIKKLVPNLYKIEINSETSNIIYYEKDENNEVLNPVNFEQLAMGMRSILGFVGDMIVRLTKNQQLINGFEELAGIVIIDEFDNHLHPKWQRLLVEKLTELFPNIQFIVSTHSPIPLLGAPANKTVILNVQRTKEEGVTIRRLEKLEKELPNLLPNVLLTSPIFGLNELKSISNKNLSEIIVNDNYNDTEKYQKLEKSIDDLFQKNNWINHELFN